MVAAFQDGKAPTPAFLWAFFDHSADYLIVLCLQKPAPVQDVGVKTGRDSYDIIVMALQGGLDLLQTAVRIHAQIVEVYIYWTGILNSGIMVSPKDARCAVAVVQVDIDDQDTPRFWPIFCTAIAMLLKKHIPQARLARGIRSGHGKSG